MHLPHFFFLLLLLPPPQCHFMSLQFCKSSPSNIHLATHASDHLKDSHSYSSHFSKGVIIIVVTGWENLYSLDLVSHYHRVFFTDLGSSFSLIVIGAIVLVGISVDATEKVATATVKACKAHPLAAHKASALLGFGGVSLAFVTARRGYRGRTRSCRLAHNRL